jgi:hypothetical protein
MMIIWIFFAPAIMIPLAVLFITMPGGGLADKWCGIMTLLLTLFGMVRCTYLLIHPPAFSDQGAVPVSLLDRIVGGALLFAITIPLSIKHIISPEEAAFVGIVLAASSIVDMSHLITRGTYLLIHPAGLFAPQKTD